MRVGVRQHAHSESISKRACSVALDDPVTPDVTVFNRQHPNGRRYRPRHVRRPAHEVGRSTSPRLALEIASKAKGPGGKAPGHFLSLTGRRLVRLNLSLNYHVLPEKEAPCHLLALTRRPCCRVTVVIPNLMGCFRQCSKALSNRRPPEHQLPIVPDDVFLSPSVVGEWGGAIEDALIGPASQHMLVDARTEHDKRARLHSCSPLRQARLRIINENKRLKV